MGAKQFALVHGMSHGAWAWSELTPLLEGAGHRVIAIDLPGHGRWAHERRTASIERYARAHEPMLSQPHALAALLQRI